MTFPDDLRITEIKKFNGEQFIYVWDSFPRLIRTLLEQSARADLSLCVQDVANVVKLVAKDEEMHCHGK